MANTEESYTIKAQGKYFNELLGDEEFDESISESKIAKAVSTYRKKMQEDDVVVPTKVEEKEEEPEEVKITGLMARRK